MLHFVQKLYYSIKYRHVLNATHEPDQSTKRGERRDGGQSESARESTAVAWGIALVFMIPVAIGCGFGLVHYRISERLADQTAVDQRGVDLDAVIESLELETVIHEGGGPDRRDSESKYCLIAIKYFAPISGRLLKKTFRLEDDSLCQKYNVGDSILAKVLPDEPEVVVLNEGRLDESWYWISLTLFSCFLGLPILAFLRMIQVSVRKPSGGAV